MRMNNYMTRCKNGHYYDPEKYENCPYCNEYAEGDDDATIGLPDVRDEVSKTLPNDNLTDEPAENGEISVTRPNKMLPVDDEKTIGIAMYPTDATETGIKAVPIEPVVGWLVCVEGAEMGKSFNLKGGKNFIGRSSVVNDITLSGDNGISRERHAVVVYEPKTKTFFAQPGTSNELFYINDKVILQVVELKPMDRILIGSTELIFVPFCGEAFSWQ